MERTAHCKTLLKDVQAKIRELQFVQGFPVACCCRCGHWWTKRTGEPKKCPKCKSKHWATERTTRQGLRSREGAGYKAWDDKLAAMMREPLTSSEAEQKRGKII